MHTSKVATKNAVRYAALFLLEKNDTTTTLEVKELLRDNEFFALQDDVSTFMQELQVELPLEAETYQGRYQFYSLPSIDSVIDDDNDGDDDDDGFSGHTPAVLSHMPTADWFEYTKRNGDTVLATDDEDNLNGEHWTVRDANDASIPMYFNSAYGRDEIRQAYASLQGVAYPDTRATLSS